MAPGARSRAGEVRVEVLDLDPARSSPTNVRPRVRARSGATASTPASRSRSGVRVGAGAGDGLLGDGADADDSFGAMVEFVLGR